MSVRTEIGGQVAAGGHRRPVAAFVLALALLAAGAALAVVAVRGPAPPRSLPDRVRAIGSSLRCPVCQNLSVADSPSGIAQQMRATIRADLQAGRPPDQIRARFVASYGEWILLSPPRHGVDLVVWVAPVLLLLGGLVVGGLSVHRWSPGEERFGGATPPIPELSPSDRRLLERALSAMPEEGSR